tara:strand:+ start:1855 stop:3924 length:2070 start_codon:yes stop_codon:yes gene_type:complete
MAFASLRFSGNLIEELSQKIPSSLFALNELIKNAYDAFSPDVQIKISRSKRTIEIVDRGNGMGANEIDSLFHISKSTKRYGYESRQGDLTRITQGSKGLGFLSVFKFGNKVEWLTCKDGIRSKFCVCKSDLVAKDDLSGSKIPVKTEAHAEKGTVITIHSNDSDIDGLLSDLSDRRVAEKLAAAIIDDSFDIKIEIENQPEIISTKMLRYFKRENEENQLFYVRYDSMGEGVEFFHKGERIASFPYPLSRTDYIINLELVIFHFGRGRSSKSISLLNRRVHDDALYPLVYINRNIFNNTVVFDPEVLRKKSSGQTLPQMIGRVNLRCKSSDLEFNSDRTNFVENNLTKSLVKDLDGLNKLIQSKGARLKNTLKERNKVPTGKAVPGGGDSEKRNGTASIFVDRKRETQFYIPSSQINLEDYIVQVKNSAGQNVERREVEVIVDGVASRSRVLPSVLDVCEKKVCFKYRDEITEFVAKEVILFFLKETSNVSGDSQKKSLFKIQSGSGYNVRMETVSEIINAIDKAYSTKYRDEYLPVIACSIRSIFEVCSDKLIKKNGSWFGSFDESKLSVISKREIKDGLLKSVVHIVLLVKKNQKLMSEVSKASGVSYTTLNNLLDVRDFRVAVKNSHVGAHQSTRYLSKPKIESCADACGYFAVICDVLLHSSIASTFHVCKVDEGDLEEYLGTER